MDAARGIFEVRNSGESKLKRGIELRELGSLEESRKALLEAVSELPEDPRTNYQCAWAHDVLGLEREAIPFYERAIEKGLEGRDLKEALIGLGSSYRCVGEPKKAVAALERATRLFPESRAAKVFLAMALHSRKGHGRAMEILLSQLAETTSDPEITDFKRAILHYAAGFGNRQADKNGGPNCPEAMTAPAEIFRNTSFKEVKTNAELKKVFPVMRELDE